MRARPATVMATIRAMYGLSVAEAWGAYRNVKAHLARPVGLVDLDRHPRIVAEEVRAARLALVKAEAAALRQEILKEERARREAPELVEEDYVEYEFSADTAGET